MMTAIAIGAGGAVGAILRHFMNGAVAGFLPAGVFAGAPIGIIIINVLGSFVMGVLTGVFALAAQPPYLWKAFLIVGLLGGFTTFSAFSLDAVMLWQRGEFALSMLYVFSSVLFSIGALFLGLWLVKVLSL